MLGGSEGESEVEQVRQEGLALLAWAPVLVDVAPVPRPPTDVVVVVVVLCCDIELLIGVAVPAPAVSGWLLMKAASAGGFLPAIAILASSPVRTFTWTVPSGSTRWTV